MKKLSIWESGIMGNYRLKQQEQGFYLARKSPFKLHE
jgi:hypothetical protein